MNTQTDFTAVAIVLVIASFVLAKLAPPQYVSTAPRVEAAINLLAEVRRRVMLEGVDGHEVLR